MDGRPAAPDRAFYDVFISYRHHDGARIDALEARIREAGFEPFRDLNFLSLEDPTDVTRSKVAVIRQQLAHCTCLILAYSRPQAGEPGASVGAWMPWELGFFDGAMSSRIGVYLVDGPRGDIEPKAYFAGSEYLQLYTELTDDNLEAFLRRNAVRERRIDNVASAFVWLQNLYGECLANPTNVAMGVTEWFSDHVARLLRQQDQVALADIWLQWKNQLDDLRATVVPALRWPILDELGVARPPSTPSLDTTVGDTKAQAELIAPGITAAPQGPLPTHVDWQAWSQQVLKALQEAQSAVLPHVAQAPFGANAATDFEPFKESPGSPVAPRRK